ncbi:uncharacterized protein LOC144115178 isoform X2 [Amblyomma americanum]
MPRRLMTLHGSPACGGGLLSRGSSERSRVSQVSKVHSKMATCKRHKERLHESISMPQLGLAPRLALELFLIGKKPRLPEVVMLAPRADPLGVVPKYRLNLSGLFTPNWSDAPALLDQGQGNHGCWCAYRPLAATQAPWSRRSATLEPHRMAINWVLPRWTRLLHGFPTGTRGEPPS